jgi:hypothetical protein
MTVRDATVAYGILFDKTRLTDGEATSQMAIQFSRVDLAPYRTGEREPPEPLSLPAVEEMGGPAE